MLSEYILCIIISVDSDVQVLSQPDSSVVEFVPILQNIVCNDSMNVQASVALSSLSVNLEEGCNRSVRSTFVESRSNVVDVH